jgi:hypothetical protein
MAAPIHGEVHRRPWAINWFKWEAPFILPIFLVKRIGRTCGYSGWLGLLWVERFFDFFHILIKI